MRPSSGLASKRTCPHESRGDSPFRLPGPSPCWALGRQVPSIEDLFPGKRYRGLSATPYGDPAESWKPGSFKSGALGAPVGSPLEPTEVSRSWSVWGRRAGPRAIGPAAQTWVSQPHSSAIPNVVKIWRGFGTTRNALTYPETRTQPLTSRHRWGLRPHHPRKLRLHGVIERNPLFTRFRTSPTLKRFRIAPEKIPGPRGSIWVYRGPEGGCVSTVRTARDRLWRFRATKGWPLTLPTGRQTFAPAGRVRLVARLRRGRLLRQPVGGAASAGPGSLAPPDRVSQATIGETSMGAGAAVCSRSISDVGSWLQPWLR